MLLEILQQLNIYNGNEEKSVCDELIFALAEIKNHFIFLVRENGIGTKIEREIKIVLQCDTYFRARVDLLNLPNYRYNVRCVVEKANLELGAITTHNHTDEVKWQYVARIRNFPSASRKTMQRIL